jgi:Ca2+-transporting ATPase
MPDPRPRRQVRAAAQPDQPQAHLPNPPRGETGLTGEEAARLLASHGRNTLVPEKRRGKLVAWLLRPFADPMAILLLIAAPTYLLIGDTVDAVVILVLLVPILAVGWVLEARAESALEKLRELTAPTVSVWRDSGYQTVPAEELVPGDLFAIQEGDVVAADGYLVRTTQMMVDESALTGESLPVSKTTEGADRDVYAGTMVLSGRGVTRVTATGATTRYGAIGTLVAGIKQPPTPLQRLVGNLVKWMGVVAAVFCVAVMSVELLRGAGWGTAIISGVSLAIAAVPEEFPMVYTLYLALGAWRLAKERALVRRLAGVETLGSTTVICSDKTGTLTMGHLEVAGVATVNGALVIDAALDDEARLIVREAILASEPKPFDPLERAILRFASVHGLDPDEIHGGDLVEDNAFDPRHKYLSHVWRRDGRYSISAKGSLEGILTRSHADDAQRGAAHRANEMLAGEGMRVLAVASGDLVAPSGDRETDEGVLRFRGLIAFTDPVRPGVQEALEECRTAGIRVIMITGDHPATAHAVVEGLGLPHADDEGIETIATGDDLDQADDESLAALVSHANVFARTRPEQKHRLVEALRRQGHVVAMTGDGINDAPALREADIGVAMGKRGTEVAREAATLVLLDDNFATIVGAVRNGRRIFENLRRAFAYLVAFHPPLLIAAFVIPVLGQPLLLLPIQLILLELVVHPTVSLVFEADPAAPDIMTRPPRRSGFLSRDLVPPFALGLTLSVAVVACYLAALGRGLEVDAARSFAFAVLLAGQIILVVVVRSPDAPVWRTSIRINRTLPSILLGSVAVLVASVYLPPLAGLLKLAPFPSAWWIAVVAAAGVATLWTEPLKFLRNRAA